MKAFRNTAALLFALALVAISGDLQACGEVMAGGGSAFRYHAFISRHPAEILIYAGPATPASSGAERAKFHDNLEKAGHKVTIATDADALAQALAARHYDVVIAYAGDMDSVVAQVANTPREPALIPVLPRDAADAREMRERFPRLVNDDASLNQILKSIEQSMKGRGT
jgi:hypothetical protein